MIEKLEGLKNKYTIMGERLSHPESISDRQEYAALAKEHSALTPIISEYERLLEIKKQIIELEAMLHTENDSDMLELLQSELCDLKEREVKSNDELKIMLLPKDEDDDKNVVIEIRAGTGGEEAALFGANLLRMYMRYAERHNFTHSIANINETEIGGIKEASLVIAGHGAYSKLKFENGVHRVQRIPETESQGRIHTSAATVAVLSEAEDVDIEINSTDLRIDTYRASGAGGQHVNKTESAIRITHLPTGLVVQCQNEKSQIKNREIAMKILKSRLYDLERQKRDSQIASERKSQIGSGDRSERIRTYNFPQGRVTDHRVNVTLYRLESFLDGDIDEMIDALIAKNRMDMLNSTEA